MVRAITAAIVAALMSAGVAHAAEGGAGAGDKTGADRVRMWGERVAKRFDRSDADRNGVLERAEVEAPLAARFTRLDADRDGVLDRDELKAARAAVAAKGDKAAEAAEARMTRADADGDGRLSRDEFLSMLPPWFVRADRDKDETVTKSELDAFVEKRQKRAETRDGKAGAAN